MPSLGYSMMPFLLNARLINVVILVAMMLELIPSFFDSLDFNKIWLTFQQLHDWLILLRLRLFFSLNAE